MKLVLLRRVEKLGPMGAVVTVKPGYGRNFLLPKGMALRATEANVKQFEEQRAMLEAENLKFKTKAQEEAAALGSLELLVVRQASESGHLYGSVSTRDIAKEVTAKFDIATDHNHIKLQEPIKQLGVFVAGLQLHPEVEVKVTLSVAPTEEEASLQLDKMKHPEKYQKEEKKSDSYDDGFGFKKPRGKKRFAAKEEGEPVDHEADFQDAE